MASVGLGISVFNYFAMEIFDFNAAVRTLVVNGTFDRRSFDEDGLPVYSSPRIGKYTSPFYVVHYGLEYSESCRAEVRASDEYHWQLDETLKYWHSSPLNADLEIFRTSADWVVNNIEYDTNGNAHLYYHFDWPYKNHPGGILRAPWWSGLAEGHAIILLMRAADCFDDKRYSIAAEALYDSILTNVEQGGSLVKLNDQPWVEEYVDSKAPNEGLSRVFNGMVYAYFGVEAFERKKGKYKMAPALRESIISNAKVFDLGYWSYYDAIGSSANIKYHRVNLALILDSRVSDERLIEIAQRWRVGADFTIPFYFIHGPSGIAKYHYMVVFLVLVFFFYVTLFYVSKRLGRHAAN